jgi:hypothetical protein
MKEPACLVCRDTPIRITEREVRAVVVARGLEKAMHASQGHMAAFRNERPQSVLMTPGRGFREAHATQGHHGSLPVFRLGSLAASPGASRRRLEKRVPMVRRPALSTHPINKYWIPLNK